MFFLHKAYYGVLVPAPTSTGITLKIQGDPGRGKTSHTNPSGRNTGGKTDACTQMSGTLNPKPMMKWRHCNTDQRIKPRVSLCAKHIALLVLSRE